MHKLVSQWSGFRCLVLGVGDGYKKTENRVISPFPVFQIPDFYFLIPKTNYISVNSRRVLRLNRQPFSLLCQYQAH